MWRISEKEKEKLRCSRNIYLGNLNKTHAKASNSVDILKIDSSLLEEPLADESTSVIGKGRFGTVHLKYFRSSPVAVKYFESSSTSEMVKREAVYLAKCSHLNLPMIYGMNNDVRPYFIVTQFYGNDSLQAETLHGLLDKSASSTVSSEQWLHIVTQISDALCYLHNKEILHNDIKKDNIVIVSNSSGFLSPILIDFGKAMLVNEVMLKKLSKEEKSKYRKQHYHIAPEVVAGTHTQSVKSDVYSLGIAIVAVYRVNKYKPLKEIARHCLQPYSSRCSSLELFTILRNLASLPTANTVNTGSN